MICFTPEDLDLLAASSHDYSPSHVSDACAGDGIRGAGRVRCSGCGWCLAGPTGARPLERGPDVPQSGEPLFTDSLEKLWNDRDRSGLVQGMLSQLPIKRLLDSINSRIALKQQGSGGPTNDSLVASVPKRYSHNKRLIEAAARAYEVRTAFVWQPVPSYRYHLRHYLSDPQKDLLQSLIKNGYTAMSGIVKDNPKNCAQDFLWLADIQEHSTESLYVDSFHYTDRFSNDIAVHIGQILLERDIVANGNARAQPLQSNRASRKMSRAPVGL